MVVFLIVIFVYDLKYYLILDKVIIPAIIFSFIVNLFLGQNIWQMLLAAVVGGGFFLAQFVLSKGRWIGGGDIRLGALMGILLGWKLGLIALIAAYLFGSIVSIILLLKKKATRKSAIPFGPFLVIGTIIAIFYGNQILEWYLSTLTI